MEKIWQHTFANELHVLSEEYPVLLTEAPLNSKVNREKMTQIMFESFDTPAMNVAVQASLALYSNQVTSGIVLDSGEGITHAVPCVEGSCLPHAIIRSDISGRHLTEHMAKILAQSNQIFKNPDLEVIRDIKEKVTSVSLNIAYEIQREQTLHCALGKPYELQDGRVIRIGNERYKCPEALFVPSLIGLECQGIHTLIYNAIMRCNPQQRELCMSNIILAGGNTMFQGIKERLQKELAALFSCSENNICIKATPDRRFATWCGGSLLASNCPDENFWISKEEYEDAGPMIIHERYI